MATLTELRNEWAVAVASATEHAKEDDQAAFDKAWAAAEEARRKYENLEKAESATKALDAQRPTIADIRNPDDATDVPGVSAEKANANPKGHIELKPNVWVPYASRNTEGFIKNSPAAVQLPSVIARYEPGGELFHEAAVQREAFDIWLRRGDAGFNREVARRGDKEGQELVRALNALQEGDDNEGGYLVPTDQRSELIHDPGVPGGVTRPISRVIPTSRDGGTFPSGAGITWGGIAEEATPADSDPYFDQVPFTIRKSGANFTVSEELLADSAVDLPAYISLVSLESKSRYEDTQSVEGDGSTEPLGLRTTGAPQGNIADLNIATTLTIANILGTFFGLPAQFRGPGAAYHTTSSFMAQTCALAASGGQVWLLPNAAGTPSFTILGIPVVMYDGTGWDDAATLGSSEEVGAIGNFGRYYWFVERVGISVRRDDSVGFRSDQIAFKARARYDSLFALANAFRIIKVS